MKIISFAVPILIMFAAICPSTAQGLFHTYVESHHPSSPSVNRLWGSFTLNEQRLFVGQVDVEFGVQGDRVQIFRSTSSQSLGEPLFTLPEIGGFYPTGDPEDPGTIGWGFEINRTLSPTEVADLQAGFWWVDVDLAALPGR